jgi:uncharacterized protein (TIGR00730 family)|tara:strand:+ start:460 stop:1236 length:777 start_codon:yes stop_codon:yes gene_type:complete
MEETKNAEGLQPEKAYKNLDFLNSKDARTLRILSEYLYPKKQFEEQNIQNTIVIFGSARAPSPEEASSKASPEKGRNKSLKLLKYYEATRVLSKRLSEWSKNLNNKDQKYVICSGGGPGIMQAANRGAKEAKTKSIALGISLPFENEPNPYASPELTFEFHYFFTRKFWFSYLAEAFVVMPGGFGTIEEFFEILTLIQTGKIKKNQPIVLFGEEYWSNLINFETLIDFGVIDKEDLNLFFITSSVDEAYQHIVSSLEK